MRIATITFLTLATSSLFAQANLFDHVYWQAYGNREAQGYGGEGMDTIGYVNGSIQHAVTIGEAQPGKIVSCYVYNRFKLDTTRHFEFPGQKVIRGDFNHDGRFDVACWDGLRRIITILLGTVQPDSFITALKLVGDENKNEFGYLDNRICVADCDSDGYDDLLVYDAGYTEDGNNTLGRMLFYKGGPTMDSIPSQQVIGKLGELYYGTLLRVGNFSAEHPAAAFELRLLGPQVERGRSDTAALYVYAFGPSFSLIPTDTLRCALDTVQYCCYNYASIELIDVDNDGAGEILLAGYDKNYTPNLKIDPTVFAFKGGPGKYFSPSYLFHRPFQTNSDKFGTKIIDVGDVTGRGYHSLLITDPQAFQNDVGAVFLFNIGSALKDSCVAVAVGQRGSFDRFGIQAIGPGDLTGDKRNEVMVGSPIKPDAFGNAYGTVTMFSGDSSYGPVITGINEPANLPVAIRLDQNYPNPFATTTDITFAVSDPKLHGKHVSVSLYDALGRKVTDVFSGTADGFGYTIRVDGSLLPSGTYTYLLQCGERFQTRLMAVVH